MNARFFRQASLFLNGNGSGEGAYVSVYIKILPGEYDALLKWPFSHTVSFTLYDQACNPDKVRKKFKTSVKSVTYYFLMIRRHATLLRASSRTRRGRTSSVRRASRTRSASASRASSRTRCSRSATSSRTTCSSSRCASTRRKTWPSSARALSPSALDNETPSPA